MRTFLLFLFTTVMVTAGSPASPGKVKLQHVILEEIIHSIRDVKGSLAAKIFVQKVITTEHCTHKNFCKAGNILSAYKAEELGLKENDWLLPRKLVAYTRDINCKGPVSEDRVQLHQLLENLQQCAQKEYAKA